MAWRRTVQRAIWAGDDVTGATVFRITRGMDAGPILAQSTVSIGAHETSGELLARLAEDGSHLLASALLGMAEGRIVPVEQPQGAYEKAEKITVEDARIRFDVPVSPWTGRSAPARPTRAPGANCMRRTMPSRSSCMCSPPARPI